MEGQVERVNHRGPSPRVRGSRDLPGWSRFRPRSIPACAGKPTPAARPPSTRTVHPRVCGEAWWTSSNSSRPRGPSPRVRGSPGPMRADLARHGSIPACAGKPRRCGGRTGASRVHPRVCGEASRCAMHRSSRTGPSPRVRGSPRDDLARRRARGSIPACAGKPSSTRPRRSRSRVHPRVCGEALRTALARKCRVGPSPRVRGSLDTDVAGARLVGSIPACAGKPRSSKGTPRRSRVHPRVCGEADNRPPPRPRFPGPSPRVRGSRVPRDLRAARSGSIPACAGKP